MAPVFTTDSRRGAYPNHVKPVLVLVVVLVLERPRMSDLFF